MHTVGLKVFRSKIFPKIDEPGQCINMYFYLNKSLQRLHRIFMTLVCSFLIVSDNTNLESKFSSSRLILLHLEDTAENLSLLETVVILQTDIGLLPVCWITRSCRETHLEQK